VAPSRRRVGRGPSRRSFLVLIEGQQTEDAYLLFWKRRLRREALIEISDFHGTPMSLVEKAVTQKTREAREQRRGRGAAHDEYWCVFDVDTHPYLVETIELAGKHGINLAISSPCIELWFLLHFTDQTAYIECRDAARAVSGETGAGKDLAPDALEALGENFDAAKERAQYLEKKHRGDGTPFPGNPSSGVWRLIDAIHQGSSASS
jgi:hypothetical protein